MELHGENSFCSESQDSNLDSSQPGHCITCIELLGGLKRMVHTEQLSHTNGDYVFVVVIAVILGARSSHPS